MVTALVIFLLFFLPFIVLPLGFSPFEAPKVIAAEIVIQALLILTILKKNSLLTQLNKQQAILAFAIILLSILHLMLFPTSTSFFGNPFRLQGIFLLWHLTLFSILASRIRINGISNLIYPLCMVLVLVISLLLGSNENGRAVGTLGEPNALAATAVFLFPFLFFKQRNFVKILGFISALTIIFLSGSRSGLLALLIQSSFVILTSKLPIAKAFIASFILLLIGFVLPILEGGGWFENRSTVWQTAFFAGMQSPILGSGFGNIEQSLHQASIVLNNMIQYQLVDSSHNIFLDFWVQGGITGFSLLVALLIISIKRLIVNSNVLELTVLLGLLTVMSFNPVSIVTLIGFWWVLGLGFRATAQDHSRPLPKDDSG